VPGSFRASAIWQTGRLDRFDADLVDAASPDFAGARMQLHARRGGSGTAIEFFVSADALRFGPTVHAGFGRDVQQFRAQGTIEPAASFSALLSGFHDWRTCVENWRAHAGTLSLENVSMQFGNLTAAGHGRLSLDDAHRMNGAIELVISHAPLPYATSGIYGHLAHAFVSLAAADAAGRSQRARLLLHDGVAGFAVADGSGFRADEALGGLDPLY
jgi:hypothetical protein